MAKKFNSGDILTAADMNAIVTDAETIKGEVSELKGDLVDLMECINDTEIPIDGYITGGGTPAPQTESLEKTFRKVPVKEGQIIKIDASFSSSPWIGYIFYDFSKNAIGSREDIQTKKTNVNIEVPQGAFYMSVSWSGKTCDYINVYKITPFSLVNTAIESTRVDMLSNDTDVQNGTAVFGTVDNVYIDKGEQKPYPSWSATTYINCFGYDKLNINLTKTPASNNPWCAFYDSDKAYISEFKIIYPTNIVDIPKDAMYVRLSNDTKTIQEMRVDFVRRAIPSYYLAHLKSKEEIIRNNYENIGTNCDSFVFITDYHYESNTKHTPLIVKHIMRESPVRFVCINGDFYNGASTKDGAKKMFLKAMNDFDYLKSSKLFVTVGNHEYNNPSASESSKQITEGDVYNIALSFNEEKMHDKCSNSYCVDNKAQKIRYIFFGCTYSCNVSEEQNVWLCNALKETPNGYSVIVFSHLGVNEDVSGWFNTLYVLIGALKAFDNHGSYTYNKIAYDFSNNNGEVIAVFSGHMHLDGVIDVDGRFPLISTTCDAYKEEFGSLIRTKGTESEQAFDVVQIDKNNKKIYMTRIGAGSNREFDY